MYFSQWLRKIIKLSLGCSQTGMIVEGNSHTDTAAAVLTTLSVHTPLTLFFQSPHVSLHLFPCLFIIRLFALRLRPSLIVILQALCFSVFVILFPPSLLVFSSHSIRPLSLERFSLKKNKKKNAKVHKVRNNSERARHHAMLSEKALYFTISEMFQCYSL